MAKAPVTAVKLKDVVMFDDGSSEEAYVMTVVDTSKQIFTGTKVADKSLYTFSPSDQVEIVLVPEFPTPKLGDELLKI